MDWHYTPLAIPLIGTAATAAVLAVYVWLHRRRVMGRVVVLLLLACAEWAMAYALELGTVGAAGKVLWGKMQYVGITIVPTAWLVFVLLYTGRDRWLTRRSQVLLSIVPVITLLLAFTNEAHGLIWSRVELVSDGTHLWLTRTAGVGFLFYAAYGHTLVLLAGALLFRMYAYSSRLYRRQVGALLVGSFAPWLAMLAHYLLPGRLRYFEPTPLAFFVTSVAVAWSLFRLRLGEIVPIAREVIIEHMAEGVIVLDVEGRVVDVNRAAQDMIGRAAAQVIGERLGYVWAEWPVRGDRVGDAGQASTEIVLGEDEGQRIYDVRVSDLLDRRSQLAGSVVVLRDVTERRRAERALRTSERWFRSVVEHSHAGVLIVGDDYRITYVNDELCRILGYPREEIVGRDFQDFLDDESREFVADRYVRRRRGEEVPARYEFNVVRKSGKKRRVEISSTVLEDPAGNMRTVGQILDITERRRAEDEVRRHTAQLEALREAGVELTAQLDLDALFQSIVLRAIGLLAGEQGELYLRPQTQDELERVAGTGPDLSAPDTFVRRGEGLVDKVWESGKPLVVYDYREWHGHVPGPSDTPVAALVGVPVRWGEELLGVLTVAAVRPGAFSVYDAELLGLFATQAAVALQNARLFGEMRQRVAELETLQRTSLRLAASMDLSTVLDTIVESALSLLEASDCHIYLYDETTDVLTLGTALWEDGRREPAVEKPRSDGLTYSVARSGLPIVINDVPHHPLYAAPDARKWDLQAIAGIPLKRAGRVLGVFSLAFLEPHRFTDEELRVLGLLADQAAVGIENAALYGEQRRRAEEANILLEIANAVNSTLELGDILEEVALRAARACEANRCTILLVDEERMTLQPIMSQFATGQVDAELWQLFRDASRPQQLVDIPEALEVVQDRRPLFLPDAQASSLPREWIDPFEVGSLLVAPLISRDRVVAIMALDRPEIGRAFTAEQVGLAMTIAGQAAVAIENARLYQETRRRLAQTQVLREVMVAAASTLDFDQVLERACDTLTTTMQVEYLGVALYDEEAGELIPHPSLIGFDPRIGERHLPLEGSVCGRVFLTGEPMIIGDVREVSFYLEAAAGALSELAVPIRAGAEVIGVLNIESHRLNAFDEEDLAFYTVIAGQLGVALQNARLYQEVRRHADELAAALARSQELDRLKSQFIQNVSHELRSPVALIRGYAELLAAGELGRLEAEQEGPVATIARRAQMLSSLVEDITLILLVEARPLAQERIGLGELARAAVEDFRVAADQAGLTLKAEIGEGLPAASGEGTYLRRVIDNLLGNAVKFTPAGGTITVGVREGEGELVLEVSDTGIGIPEDQQERIFDRFYQIDGSARRRYGGAGLGLALVKEIVEAHGGTVRVSSSPKQGSTFAITLPVARKDESATPSA